MVVGDSRAAGGEVGEAGDGAGDEEDEEERGGVAQRVEDATEAVEGIELELERGAVVKQKRGRVKPGVSERTVVLVERDGVAPGRCDGALEVSHGGGGMGV